MDLMNLSKKMSALLPKEIMRILKNIGKLSNSLRYPAFVVGGLTRDLILGVKNLDLDIVVEGDAIKLGHVLSKHLKAALVVHKKFGTCSLITRDGLKIDLATARKEIYERPAALPTVESSSLKDDLIRRDFTINAMAISLNKGNFGQLVDFFNGQKDLARGRIKVLHDGSFIDDPTRIFRAVRFEQRFGFAIDSHTEGLIKNAIEKEMFDKVEPQRIRDEVILILKEDEPLKALRRMAELDELRFLHDKIMLDKNVVRLLESVGSVCDWYRTSAFKKRAVDEWLIYLVALFRDLSYNETIAICNRLVFRRGEVLRILSYKRDAGHISRALSTRSSLPPSKIYKLLEPLSFEVILLVMAGSDSKFARSRIRDFFQKYNGARIHLNGDDIKKMDLKPCPDFKVIMNKILYEKLDSRIFTRKDEIACAKKMIKKLCR